MKFSKFFLKLLTLRCSTENVSGDSNIEKPILALEDEKHLVFREGILSRKKLNSGSWLLSDKLLFNRYTHKYINVYIYHGLVAELVGASEQNSVVVGSNFTLAKLILN